jgi:hypothetical protein
MLQEESQSSGVQVCSSHQATDGGADVKLDSLAAAERKQTRRSIDTPSSPSTTNLFTLLACLEEEDGDDSAQPGVHTEVAASAQVVQTIDMSAVPQLPDGVEGGEERGGQQVRDSEELWEWDMRREKRAKLTQERQQAAADREAAQRARGLMHDSSELITVGGRINGQPCEVFVDPGASTNFVSRVWAEKHGLEVQQPASTLEVVMADGHKKQALGIVDVEEMDAHGSIAAARLVVMDGLQYPVILGMPWLRKAEVVLSLCHEMQWNGVPIRLLSPQRAQTVRTLAAIKINPKHAGLVESLMEQYASVFAKDLPRRSAAQLARAVKHVVKLKDVNCRPVCSRERRRSPADVETLREATLELERLGLIEDSDSPWSSQAVLVPKVKDGKATGEKRPCWDYRGVNEMIVPDAFPLPLPAVMFDHLLGSTVFSKMDLTKGYWQIPMDEASKKYYAFSTPLGLKQPLFMPFGPRNAPATFQREMQRVLKDRLYKGVMVFMDDIIIHSKTAEEHVELVGWVLRRLQEEGYYAHPDKCEFFMDEMYFLGHTITAQGMSVQDYKVKAVSDYPVPKTVTQVRSFLGMAGYYRKFIRDFSKIAAPLTNLQHKDARFQWGDKQQAAFDALKQALTRTPVLIHPDPTFPYCIHTDASGFATSAVLSQDQGQGRLPVEFTSRKMNDAETRYAVHEQELLAIVRAVEEWGHYLIGSSFPVHIFTDHASLQFLNTQPDLTARQARWVEKLAEHELLIEHLPGTENRVADALSRRADYAQTAAEAAAAKESTVRPARLKLTLATSTAAQLSQERPVETVVDASPLLHDIKDAAVRDPAYQMTISKAAHAGLTVEDGLLYSPDRRLYVPDDAALKRRLLRELHDAPTGGHLGMIKTGKKVADLFYWYGMQHDIEDYVRGCVTCARSKPSQLSPAGKLQPLPIPQRCWETISVDFIGPLPKTKGDHFNFVLMVVDKFSKLVHYVPCYQSITAEGSAKLVWSEVIRHHGVPSSIISDRDPRFTSDLWRELWRIMGTDLRMSTSYHPQSNGQTERANRVLEEALRAFVNNHRDDWDQFLAPLEFAVNSSVHASTGMSAFAMNGSAPRSPLDVALGRQPQTSVQSVEDLVNQARTVIEDARGFMLMRQAKQKKAADKKRRDEKYAVGDQVMLSTAPFPSHRGKLKDPYIGPFRVKEVRGDVNVVLELPPSMRIHDTFHVEKLKRFVPSSREWPGRRQQDRPAPVLVEGKELYEVETVIGKREKMVNVVITAEPAAGDQEDATENVPVGVRRSERLAGRSVSETSSAAARKQVKGKVQRERRPVTMYLVVWKGYGEEMASWVAEDDMQHAQDAIAEYELRQLEAAREDRGEESMALRVNSMLVVAADGTVRWTMR